MREERADPQFAPVLVCCRCSSRISGSARLEGRPEFHSGQDQADDAGCWASHRGTGTRHEGRGQRFLYGAGLAHAGHDLACQRFGGVIHAPDPVPGVRLGKPFSRRRQGAQE